MEMIKRIESKHLFPKMNKAILALTQASVVLSGGLGYTTGFNIQRSFGYSTPIASALSSGSASYQPLPSVASTSSFVQPAMSYSTPIASALSSGSASYQPLPSVQPAMASYGYSGMADMGSNTNPYWAENLKRMGGNVISRQMRGSKGVQQRMIGGEKHVVHNDLKVLENFENDKTIFTKKIVHHSPVLHKTIRTHEIAQDAVHEKLVHHLNTVEDQWKKVAGQNYVGGEQHVDHRTEEAPAPSIIAKPVIGKAKFSNFGKVF